ncbi:hypothetical protein HGH93_23265 [Chitinophaga polysaccharea]|uniref:hypothetical protein n=1 Tax=Chitinophaga TaxID=79328 RepID=UPI001455CA37|nr:MULTISPECIES: hypothetical protein [Chitinophaga]NLR61042.1 hypothetical protein [Chitinophaga polysaccharea]NLU96251.1 hypothetical protein [Chitinophaga sp. Ak27]
MKYTHLIPLSLLAASALFLTTPSQYLRAGDRQLPVQDSSCLVKTDVSFDFADNMRKKVTDVIEDKFAGGIEEGGKTTWENSPDAPEYYQVILRKTKVTIHYKGTVCQDRLIWQNVEDCKAALKKLLNNQ